MNKGIRLNCSAITVLLLLMVFISAMVYHQAVTADLKRMIREEEYRVTEPEQEDVMASDQEETETEEGILLDTEDGEEEDIYFRDRIKENEEFLEESTVAQGPEDIINEDYSPQSGLSDEELKTYMEKIFLDLCREPEKIDLYHDVFTEESISRFKEIEWKYDHPKEIYDVSHSIVRAMSDDGTINGRVSVDSKYAVWEIDWDDEDDGKWAYSARYCYHPEDGMVEIEKDYLFISIW